MKFYSNFRYQYTHFFPSLDACIKATNKGKKATQLDYVWQVKDNSHVIVKAIINGRIYGKKHAFNNGFKSLVAFSKARFLELNKIKN